MRNKNLLHWRDAYPKMTFIDEIKKEIAKLILEGGYSYRGIKEAKKSYKYVWLKKSNKNKYIILKGLKGKEIEEIRKIC